MAGSWRRPQKMVLLQKKRREMEGVGLWRCLRRYLWRWKWGYVTQETRRHQIRVPETVTKIKLT